MQGQDIQFSVLLPTYASDDSEELKTAIESVLNQTRKPDEVLIVKDGPVPNELEEIIRPFEDDDRSRVRSVQHSENRGLGIALRTGMNTVEHDYVARMDADDISVPTRFEKQTDYLAEHPGTDIVGGYIAEFETDPANPISRREVPTSHDEIRRMARFRSPMNHGTVLFDRSAVLRAGNYRPVSPMEDYDLWVRMLLNGATFANIPEVLVNVRAGTELYERRGGLAYAREEVRTQYEFYRRGFTSLPICLFNLVTRVGLRLVPNSVRRWAYERFAR